MGDGNEVVIKLLAACRQPQDAAAGVGFAGGAGQHALFHQTVHNAVDGGGLHGQMLLQLLLGHGAGLAVHTPLLLQADGGESDELRRIYFKDRG